MSYIIRYVVQATTRLEAIAKASALLRTGLRLNGVSRISEISPGTWAVALHVWEDA